MSDSDSDCFSPPPRVVASFNNSKIQHIKVRGPNFDATTNPSLYSFGNSLMVPNINEYRRATSTMSIQSVDCPQRRQQSFCQRGFAQSSIIHGHGRPTSPVESVRSMASNMSRASERILEALEQSKSQKFNQLELTHIKQAFNKFMKGRVRKRIAKRINVREFMKGARRKPGGESGDQASNSSMSSEDCRSTRTGITERSYYTRTLNTFIDQARRGIISDDALSITSDFTTTHSTRSENRAGNPWNKIAGLKKTIQDQSMMFRDATENMRHGSFNNFLSVPSRNINSLSRKQNTTIQTTSQRFKNSIPLQTQNRICRTENFKQNPFNTFSLPPRNRNSSILSRTQNTTIQSTGQKDRFKNSIPLPSQRFNKSAAVFSIPEEHQNLVPVKSGATNIEMADPKRNVLKRAEPQKRNLYSSDESADETMIISSSKKTKITTPKKVISYENSNGGISEPANHQTERASDFIFAKPTLPLRDSLNMRNVPKAVNNEVASKPVVKSQSKNISKIGNTGIDFKPAEQRQTINNTNNTGIDAKPAEQSQRNNMNKCVNTQIASKHVEQSKTVSEITRQSIDQDLSKEQTMVDEHSETYLSDVSRPSFMKRKLFTQTLDVTEKMNISTESSPSASPQIRGLNGIKEKNKSRKLVTNQSCLSRDVNKEDDNLLDLIHKIVPPDRMNITTNSTQRIEMCPKNQDANTKTVNNKPLQEDNCDETAVSSAGHIVGDISDTFTDEELFSVLDKNESKKNKTQKETSKKPVPVKEKPLQERTKEKPKSSQNKLPAQKNEKLTTKKTAALQVLRFWQIDSDADGPESPKQTISKEVTRNEKAAPTSVQPQPENKLSRVAKNVKALIEISVSSDLSLEHIEERAKNIASNKRMRLRAIKAIKDKQTDSCKLLNSVELRKSVCDVLDNDESIGKRKSTHSKHIKASKRYNTKKKTNDESNTVKNIENNKDKQTKAIVEKCAPKNENCTQNKQPVREVEGNTAVELSKNKKNKPNKTVAAHDTKTTKRTQQQTKQSTTTSTNTDNTEKKFSKNEKNNPNKTVAAQDTKTTRRTQQQTKQSTSTSTITDNTAKEFSKNEKTTKRTQQSMTTLTNTDNEVAKSDLNVSKRGRVRKKTQLYVASSAETSRTHSVSKDLLNRSNTTNRATRTRFLETPKNKSLPTLNTPKRGRARNILSTSLSPRVKISITKKPQKFQRKKPTKSTQSPMTIARQSLNVNKKKIVSSPKKQVLRKDTKKLPTKSQKQAVTVEDQTNIRENEPESSASLRKTRSREVSLLNSSNILKNDVKRANTSRQTKIGTSNKENIGNSKERRRQRIRTSFNCCEVDDALKPLTNKVPCKKTVSNTDKYVSSATPVSKSPTVSKSRPKAGAKTNDEAVSKEGSRQLNGALGLGFATMTIGIGPRHCAIEESVSKIMDDGNKTVRSMSSASCMTRSRRPKFIHVF